MIFQGDYHAATNKALAIQEQKRTARNDYADVMKQIHAACVKVPARVISGSAQLAVAWRTEAEKWHCMSADLGQSLTLEALNDSVSKARKVLAFLVEPTA